MPFSSAATAQGVLGGMRVFVELSLSHREDSDRVIVTAQGEFDMYNSPKLNKLIDDILSGWRHEYPFTWIFDLTGVSFVDSSVLHVFLRCVRSTARIFGRQYEDSQILPEARTSPHLNTQGRPIVTILCRQGPVPRLFHLAAVDTLVDVRVVE